jgi:cation diffusion facilitator family transporter
MILLAGVVSAVRAVEGFIHPDLHVSRIGLTLGLMLTTLVINGWLGFHLISTGKRHTSATLEADGWHLLADAVTSLAACAALVIVWWTHWNYADPIAALAVAVYIGRIGVKLLTQSSAGLMDRQDVEDDRLLHEILTAHVGPDGREPRICSFHKLRHRHSGRYHWVDFHIMVPARWDIRRGHEVASSIEYEIEQALGEGNATAHVEPCGDEACASCAAAEPEDEKLKSFSPAG